MLLTHQGRSGLAQSGTSGVPASSGELVVDREAARIHGLVAPSFTAVIHGIKSDSSRNPARLRIWLRAKAITQPSAKRRTCAVTRDAGAWSHRTGQARSQEAIRQHALAAQPHDRCFGGYARGSRVATSQPIPGALHVVDGSYVYCVFSRVGRERTCGSSAPELMDPCRARPLRSDCDPQQPDARRGDGAGAERKPVGPRLRCADARGGPADNPCKDAHRDQIAGAVSDEVCETLRSR